jgi:hypothetical protein
MNEHPGVTVSVDHAIELGELLEFVSDWLGAAPPAVAASLSDFVGAPGYDVADLRADLTRFSFLLGVAETLAVAEEQGP